MELELQLLPASTKDNKNYNRSINYKCHNCGKPLLDAVPAQQTIKLPFYQLRKEVHLKPAEIKMAEELIKQLSDDFKIDEYRDTYTDELMKVIEAKAKGKTPDYKPLKVVHSNTTEDLMQKLKASLKTQTKKAS